MSSYNSTASFFSALDYYYMATSTNIYLYGYTCLMVIGFVGNVCQMITFTRKTMRIISTGVLFLALSISDTIYLLLAMYVLLIYGFKITDQSNYAETCRFRHFFNYLSTNFSAWMLVTISCDRWIRTQFPLKAQRLCTPRTALYSIIIALIFNCLLHFHLLTPMFGEPTPGVSMTCAANRLYPTYVYFYVNIWPTMTILSTSVIPAVCMIFFLIAITIIIRNQRNRVMPVQQPNLNPHERRRIRFLHRQMLILMIATLILFFATTLPVAIFRFGMSTLGIRLAISIQLLLAAIFGFITVMNYSLNFYLHCLTSRLFRKEFFKSIPCSISIKFGNSNDGENGTGTRRQFTRQQQGTVTQLMGQISHTYAQEKLGVTSV